jgi:hypothetical protein
MLQSLEISLNIWITQNKQYISTKKCHCYEYTIGCDLSSFIALWNSFNKMVEAQYMLRVWA